MAACKTGRIDIHPFFIQALIHMAGGIQYRYVPFHNNYNLLQNEFALLLHVYGCILSK